MAQKNLYLQNRNRLSDIENWLPRGWGGKAWEFGSAYASYYT